MRNEEVDGIKEGDIISVSLNPTLGHEQAGTRPVLVVSNDEFYRRTRMLVICPITNTNNGFPLHIELDKRTKTTGVVLCEHLRTIDPRPRFVKKIEEMPSDIMQKVRRYIHTFF